MSNRFKKAVIDDVSSRSIDDVWQNPFGFTVTQYAIRSDRSE